MTCPKCNDTGAIETGNNDLPCDCPAGARAVFNGPRGAMTGVEVRGYLAGNAVERDVAIENIKLRAALKESLHNWELVERVADLGTSPAMLERIAELRKEFWL